MSGPVDRTTDTEHLQGLLGGVVNTLVLLTGLGILAYTVLVVAFVWWLSTGGC